MKKQTLKLLKPAEAFTLFGLATPEKDYKICWYLNKFLHLDFEKQEDLELDSKKDAKKIFFSKFHFNDDDNRREYYLLGNKNQSNVLLAEWKDMDYLLKINGKLGNQEIESILGKLKLIPSVQIAVEINIESLKTKENIIFE